LYVYISVLYFTALVWVRQVRAQTFWDNFVDTDEFAGRVCRRAVDTAIAKTYVRPEHVSRVVVERQSNDPAATLI